MIFILTSDEPWGKMMHTQLHYALELSANHTVYFIDPPRKWPPPFRNFFNNFRKVNDRLFIIPYLNVLPSLNGFRTMTRINDFINFLRLKSIIKKNAGEQVVIWRFDTLRMIHSCPFDFDGAIYHIVDDYRGKSSNKYLLRNADLVITTSPRNKEYFSKLHKNVHLIPQAISDDEFLYDAAETSKIKNQFGDFILFTGTLSDANNYELILQLIHHFPQNNFLFIGPEMLSAANKELFTKIIACKNAHYLGIRDGKSLKNYIHAAAVCIIPYHFAKKNQGDIRSPLKALHYLSQFKPVISSIDCEIEELENKAIYLAENSEAFIRWMEVCLQNKNPYDREAVKKYLENARYKKFIDKILELLSQAKSLHAR